MTVVLHSTDILLILFWMFLALSSLVFASSIPFWWLIISANLAASILICAVAYASQSTGSRVLRWVHYWSAFPLVVFTYKQLYFMIGPIHHRKDYDQLLIMIDRRLLGANPT